MPLCGSRRGEWHSPSKVGAPFDSYAPANVIGVPPELPLTPVQKSIIFDL
ncbi:MAG: hypothetical protein SWX82_25920 [Cyanobacteriota bacterium]|nr:hypothetical protein [Cyanobacteriota bacterium]